MFKIGLIGNSSTGKTTSAMALVSELKARGLGAAHYGDACRFISFKPDLFDTRPEARLHVLFKQMEAEAERSVRPDVEYLVCERTAADWYFYYRWTCERMGVSVWPEVTLLVQRWMRGYDLLLYLSSEGMDYIPDGFRPPSSEIRRDVDRFYREYVMRNERVVCIGGVGPRPRAAAVIEAVERWLPNHLPARLAEAAR